MGGVQNWIDFFWNHVNQWEARNQWEESRKREHRDGRCAFIYDQPNFCYWLVVLVCVVVCRVFIVFYLFSRSISAQKLNLFSGRANRFELKPGFRGVHRSKFEKKEIQKKNPSYSRHYFPLYWNNTLLLFSTLL